MSNLLTSVERIEKVMFQSGHFTVKNVVLLGTKGANSNRLNPIYERSYPSNKYNDRNQLTSIRFNQNEYVVLAYNDFEQKINEEIFVSYPNYYSLVYFFVQCLDLLNKPGVFTNNSVATQYTEYTVESDPLVSGKKMIAIPAVWDGADNSIRKGLTIFLNSEEVFVQLEAVGISSLVYILENFNLSLASNQLLIMGMLNELASGNIAAASNKTFQSNSTQRTTGVSTGAKRGLFGNNNSKRNAGLGSRTTATQQTQVPDPVEENVQPEQTTKKRLSMNDITKKASEIEVEEFGDVVL